MARVELDPSSAAEHYKPSAEESAADSSATTAKHVVNTAAIQTQLARVFAALERSEPWLLTEKLVVKPDQLIKRRGKLGLLGINLDWAHVKQWISERAGKEIQVMLCVCMSGSSSAHYNLHSYSTQVDAVKGTLKSFIIEPFVPHAQETEHYICIQALREVGCSSWNDFQVYALYGTILSHRATTSTSMTRAALTWVMSTPRRRSCWCRQTFRSRNSRMQS